MCERKQKSSTVQYSFREVGARRNDGTVSNLVGVMTMGSGVREMQDDRDSQKWEGTGGPIKSVLVNWKDNENFCKKFKVKERMQRVKSSQAITDVGQKKRMFFFFEDVRNR